MKNKHFWYLVPLISFVLHYAVGAFRCKTMDPMLWGYGSGTLALLWLVDTFWILAMIYLGTLAKVLSTWAVIVLASGVFWLIIFNFFVPRLF